MANPLSFQDWIKWRYGSIPDTGKDINTTLKMLEAEYNKYMLDIMNQNTSTDTNPILRVPGNTNTAANALTTITGKDTVTTAKTNTTKWYDENQDKLQYQADVDSGAFTGTFEEWMARKNTAGNPVTGTQDGTDMVHFGGDLYYKDLDGKRYWFTSSDGASFYATGDVEELSGGSETYEDYYDAQGYLHHYDKIAKVWQVKGYDPSKATSDTSESDALAREALDWERQKWAEQQALEREKYLATLQQSPRDWIRYWNTAFGANPAVPTWLTQYNPQLASGSTIRATETIAPSGQWLNRASPTVKQGLLGYADWSANQGVGMTGDDLLQQTVNMLPTAEPYSKNAWRPTKQAGW